MWIFLLRPLAVMIGPNGSGKTSLSRVCSWLFNQAMQEDLSKAIEQQGGIVSIASRMKPAPDQVDVELSFYSEESGEKDEMVYRVHLSANPGEHPIRLEQLERRWTLRTRIPIDT